MRKVKSKAYAVRKSRNGSKSKMKPKKSKQENGTDDFSVTRNSNTNLKIRIVDMSSLSVKSKIMLCVSFPNYSLDMIKYLNECVASNLLLQSESNIRLDFSKINCERFYSDSILDEENTKTVIFNYYCASLLEAAPDSPIKDILMKTVGLSIEKVYILFSPKETSQEIFDKIIFCFQKLFDENFLHVKNFIEEIANERPDDTEFNDDERMTLSSYFNFEYSDEIQIWCLNIYRSYLLQTKLSNSITDSILKFSFGVVWTRFKEEWLIEFQSTI